MAKNGNFRFLLLELILADQLADLPPTEGAKNGNFRFLDHLAAVDHLTLHMQMYPHLK